MPSVAEIIKTLQENKQTGFSVEILPPLKGKNISKTFADIEKLAQFGPRFVNITTHPSEPVFKETADGTLRKLFVRKRPGSVAVAAAIQHRFGLPTVPHIICNGFTKEETEYVLIDLNFLGIHDLFLLRGDINKEILVPKDKCHPHATDLIRQVNNFNAGISIDGSTFDAPDAKFSFGVAGYPEKHEEAPNFNTDLRYLREKQDLGAEYVITQLFYDNQKYYDFVDKARAEGITIPIIPGLKPLSRKAQLSILPRTFSCQLPQDLVSAVENAPSDADVKEIGKNWLLQQADDLKSHGVPCVHFYTLGAVDTVCSVASQLFK